MYMSLYSIFLSVNSVKLRRQEKTKKKCAACLIDLLRMDMTPV